MKISSKNLYKNLLKDPDKYMNPHKAMEQQIADLIIVLSRPEWIDFSKPENQVSFSAIEGPLGLRAWTAVAIFGTL